MIIVIDNYDSFTYNLVQDLLVLNQQVKVIRNDQASIKEIINLKPDGIVISPGPSTPQNAGIILELINQCTGLIPILGVCLGMQAIVQAKGGKVLVAPTVYHGKTSEMETFLPNQLFADIPSGFTATRYHSLFTDPSATNLTVTAQNIPLSKDDPVFPMAVENAQDKLYGFQFHCESYQTQFGQKMLQNFLDTLTN